MTVIHFAAILKAIAIVLYVWAFMAYTVSMLKATGVAVHRGGKNNIFIPPLVLATLATIVMMIKDLLLVG